MAPITRIDIRIKTGNLRGAGTDGRVYFGIAGREFYVDTTQDDLEKGEDKTFTFGDGGNTKYSKYNDPRTPQLDTGYLNQFPLYVRFEPTGDGPDWFVAEVTATVNSGPQQVEFVCPIKDIWLGEHYGEFLYLRRK